MMERKCAEVLKEALILHTREINDLMHDAEQWKQKCDTQQTQQKRLQEESKALENKNISLQSTIESLKEQIKDLKETHRESSGLRCKMCDHLQRMNDSLTEAYSNNLREKDRRISDLENQLFEYSKNSSTEKSWNVSIKTPHKPRSQQRAYLNRSLQSDSPDSTSRITPNKADRPRGEASRADLRAPGDSSDEKDCKTSQVSSQEEKGPKLRLRSRKRNRYTEDPSPKNKRAKFQPKVVLVPETCDPDIMTEDQGEEIGGEEECLYKGGRVPDTEAGTETSTASGSESDDGRHEMGSRYSLRSSLFSPSSEESDTVLKSPQKSRSEEQKTEMKKENQGAPNPRTRSDPREALGEGGDGYIQSSPIFQVYKKSNLESPDVTRVDTGAESDAESPLLLKVSKNSENKTRETTPDQTRLFEDDCVGIVSPASVNSSFSKFRSLSQGRQRRKLSQSRLSGSEERKKRFDAGETWLNTTKTAVKDSPTLRQSTLSQVFMNVPTKPQAEKPSESDDIQKAIELSLRDQGGGSHQQAAQKENLSPFKRPLTPRKCKKSIVTSPRGRRRSKRPAYIVCDPDETVPPLGPGTAEMSPDPMPGGDPLNGSIDPRVQLSVLCDSQSLKSDDLPDLEPPAGVDKAQSLDNQSQSLDNQSQSLNNQSQIGDLADFRITDLRKSSNPLTSTCIDVEDPSHQVEEDSQSIPCSIKFGDGRRKRIRIPGSFVETKTDLDSEALIPDHEDSFDRVPGKEQPNFAHVDVVRKQDERRRLPAHKCEECREYYEGMGLSEEEIQQRLQTCSRHRAKHAAPGTPEHFWDIGMEDTLECEERGYINTKDPDEGKPRFRRKRQLNKIFKSKNEEEDPKV